MAINKTINKSTKSHGAMRNCIEYVLREDKTNRELVYVTGPFSADDIAYDSVYRSFLEEKKLWGKDSGRMYAHNIISWHKEENLTLQQAFVFGKEFAEKWFDGFQTLIGVHKDRDHVHLHMVTNTVSYEDGHKLHNSKKDMERMKEVTNQMCLERGLSVAQKGKDFYGKDLEEGHVRAWSKDKYHLLLNDHKKSHVAECALALMEVREQSCNKEEFVTGMVIRGWRTTWLDSRKNITFENDEGKKVRDSNISKTFQMDVSKEGLLNEFERQAERREELRRGEFEDKQRDDSDLEQYYREIQEVVAGTIRSHEEDKRGIDGNSAEWQTRGSEEDNTVGTEEWRARRADLIHKLRDGERASKEQRDNKISERQDREIERERQSIERQRAIKEAEPRAEREHAGYKTRSSRRGISR